MKKFTLIFFTILITAIIVQVLNCGIFYKLFTKSAITLSLLFYIYQLNKTSSIQKSYLIFGLLFSMLGDIFLVFTNTKGYFFLAGLAAFFLAHLMYISAFLKKEYISGMRTAKGVFILGSFAILIFYFIREGLGDLMPYVIAYMLILICLVLTAYLRKLFVDRKSYLLVLIGSICFMTSDSILAIDKFYMPIYFRDLIVLGTYGLAQYLIVKGGLAAMKNINK